MSDQGSKPISGLPAAITVDDTHQFATAISGGNERVSAAQLKAYIGSGGGGSADYWPITVTDIRLLPAGKQLVLERLTVDATGSVSTGTGSLLRLLDTLVADGPVACDGELKIGS